MKSSHLDAVDRQLLHALTVAPRAPFRLLAEVIGVSDQTIARRYRRLAETAGLRVYGLIDRAAAASAVQSVPGRFWTWTAADVTGQVQPILHAFAGTEQGLSALAVSDGPDTWAARAVALRPELDADPARAMLTTWNDDPWAAESYSAGMLTAARGDPDIPGPPGRPPSISPASAPPVTRPARWKVPCGPGSALAGEVLARRPLPADASSGSETERVSSSAIRPASVRRGSCPPPVWIRDRDLLLVEGDVAAVVPADAVERGRVRARVAPRCVVVGGASHRDVVILGDALPRAGVRRRALTERAGANQEGGK